MNYDNKFSQSSERLLAKLGGRFILRVQFQALLLASVIGPAFGLYFIYATINLTVPRFLQLLGCLYFFIFLIDVLHLVYVSMATRQARHRLDEIYKTSTPLDGVNDLPAWDEIAALPKRSALTRILLDYLLVILPVVLVLHWLMSITLPQIVVIFTGGTLAILADIILGFFFLDLHISPARKALLPRNPVLREIRSGIGQQTRLYFVIASLLVWTILTVGGIGVQRIQSLTPAGADLSAVISQFQIQVGIIGIVLFAAGVFLASRMIQAISKPSKEISTLLEKINSGEISKRAEISTSDEAAQSTISLNLMLDRLQATQLSVEQQVTERTQGLEQKNRKLLVAAQIAREASSERDLDSMLSRTAVLISERFGFYHAGVFLLDETGEYVVLRAASSEGGKRMLKKGHRLRVGQQGIVGAAAYQSNAHIAVDVSTDVTFYKNPDLPLTQSEAAFPLTARGRVIGILDLQSTEKLALVQTDLEIIQTLADQLGLVIHNAQLLSESQNALLELEITSKLNIRRAWQERLQGRKQSFRYSSSGFSSRAQNTTAETPGSVPSDQINVPINLRGQQIGNIVLQQKAGGTWGEADRSLAAEIASQVGLALENARLLDDAQRHAAQEQALSDLTSRLGQYLDPDMIMQAAIRELHRLPNVDEVSLFISPTKPSDTPDRTA